MDTSFLRRVTIVFAGALLTLFFSSCQKTSTSPSNLHDMAIKGDAAAQYNLGKNYAGYDGRGVPQD